MREEHGGTVAKALLLVGGFVAKACAEGSNIPMDHIMRHLYSSSAVCADEADACIASTSCVSCDETFLGNFDGCFASFSSASTCDDFFDALCCTVEGCEDNEEYADIVGCVYADLGCGVIDIGDCPGGSGATDSGSDTTTDSTTSSSDCPTEVSACSADNECLFCTQAYVDTAEGCFASATGSTCDDLEEAVCCAVDGCEDNVALNDLLACLNSDSPCSIDIGDCASDGSRGNYGSDTTTDTDSAGYLTTPTITPTTDSMYPSMTTSETECAIEVEACNDDTECVDCATSYAALVEGCIESAGGTTCDDLEGAVCCAVDGCEDNDALNDLLGAFLVVLCLRKSLACSIADTGCSIDIGDCASDGSRGNYGSDTTTDTDSAGYLTTPTITPTTDSMYPSMTTSETECAIEVEACNDDTECVDCATSYAALVEGCIESAGGTTCDDLEGAVCCAVDGCEDNDALNDLLGAFLVVLCLRKSLACSIADTGCSIDIGDCASDGSRGNYGSDTTTDTDSAGYLTTPTITPTTDSMYPSMTTSETECAIEVEACNDDTECVDCATSYAALVEGCIESAGGTTCDDLEGAVCCAVDGCEDNDALNDLLACSIADTGCSIDIGDCASDGSRGNYGSDTTTDTDSEIDSTTDIDSTAADDGESTSSTPLPIGDDDEDENDATEDADPTNTESSATRSAAAKGGSAFLWLIATAAPSLWRRF
ncbi:unnamed protein product [Ectocarpus sp. CCAP 1310/34]|nr:unnamed protein product [Ectocarpus sp. CCAP 1310/34]